MDKDHIEKLFKTALETLYAIQMRIPEPYTTRVNELRCDLGKVRADVRDIFPKEKNDD